MSHPISTGFPTRPGEMLTNGTTLVAEHVYQKPDDPDSQVEERRSIVLAVTASKHTPYATWDRLVSLGRLATGGKQWVDTMSFSHYSTNLKEAVADFEARVMEKDTNKQNEYAIHTRGEYDGKAAASWFFDGNTPSGVYPRILKGIEDGDPVVMDMLPTPRVGGENADEPTWEEIVKDETNIEEMSDDGEQDLYEIYSAAFQSAVEAEISRICKVQLD